MPSPFPGMDPYLEQRSVWRTLHNRLLTGISDELQPQIAPTYWVAVEELTYEAVSEDLLLLGSPDASVVDVGAGAPRPSGEVTVLPRAVEVVVPEPERVREKYWRSASRAQVR